MVLFNDLTFLGAKRVYLFVALSMVSGLFRFLSIAVGLLSAFVTGICIFVFIGELFGFLHYNLSDVWEGRRLTLIVIVCGSSLSVGSWYLWRLTSWLDKKYIEPLKFTESEFSFFVTAAFVAVVILSFAIGGWPSSEQWEATFDLIRRI